MNNGKTVRARFDKPAGATWCSFSWPGYSCSPGLKINGQHIAANLSADSELRSRAIVDRQTLDKGNESAMNGLQRVV
jgi:hypothetical protein